MYACVCVHKHTHVYLLYDTIPFRQSSLVLVWTKEKCKLKCFRFSRAAQAIPSHYKPQFSLLTPQSSDY